MFKSLIAVIVVVIITKTDGAKKPWAIVGNPEVRDRPCEGNDDIVMTYEPGLPPGEENQYYLSIGEELPALSKVKLKFDSEATVTLTNPEVARISSYGDEFLITFFKPSQSLSLNVKGSTSGKIIPYLTSVNINTSEYCEKYRTGLFDEFIIGQSPLASISLSTPDTSCGRRKVDHTELIVNGQKTKPGDWPWHVALYRLDRSSLHYICGGTLMSKTLVLTAAHCVTLRGEPVLTESLNVVLGKHNLIGGDTATQEREVHEIVVHEGYDHKTLNNDIAIMKLKSEVVFNDYIQPACLWSLSAYKKLPAGPFLGTVVGWGFDQTDNLASKLQQAKMPKISESKCLRSNPVFFSKMLTPQKFCAGYVNGTSACNGDSGGGFFVFVPDTAGDGSMTAPGSYHVRGIVSSSLARRDAPICDRDSYVLFTDVAKFRGWVTKFMNGEK